MFFLSKLLPLFVYPIGLSSLLLALALVWVWKHPKRATWAIALALFILFFSGNPVVSDKLVSTLENQYSPPSPVPTVDAIIVLGGATAPQISPRPWVEVLEAGDRILYGARLYNQQKAHQSKSSQSKSNQSQAPKLILSGGRVTWRGGSDASEADDMKELALAMNVAESDILLERTSLNTRQNAVNVAPILTEQSIQSVLLVTSAIHMPRSVAIFQKLGIEVIPAPTDYLAPTEDRINTLEGRLLSLIPDAKSTFQFTRALKEYVGFVIYRLRGWV